MKPLAITLLFLLLTGLVQSMAIAAEDKHQGFINNWTILGPFPNPERTPDTKGRGAFDVDYLASLGGEPKARIKSGTILEVTGDSQTTTLTAIPAKPGEVVDFKDYFTVTDQKLVYAYAEITADTAIDGLFFLGSDDGAKAWVNGNLVLDVLPQTGRGYAPRQDQFNAKLNKGVNTILVKVENGMGDWKLGVEVYTGDTARKLQAEIKKEKDLREFQNQDLVPANVWPSYVFWPDYDGTPRIIWRDADRVRELIGNAPTQVRWFDSQLNEVEQPDKPGRYAAYIESKMNDGTPIRRSITFFNASGGLDPWADWDVKVSCIGKPIDPDAWNERSDIISRSTGDLFRQSLIFTEAGAVFLSGLCEAKPNGGTCSFTDSPEVLHDDFHLALKMKLQKLDDKTRPLALPKDRSASPAPVLHEDTPLAAGVRMDAKEKIDAVCRQWADDSGEPFSILVARHGVIITHAAFGKDRDGNPVTTDYRTEIASITKAISGMLFSQFLDQGYVKLDDPIGNYLPGFPTKGEKAITYRQLFTHTTGLSGHGEWGGLHNPHLENVILNGLGYLKPGKAHNYNGMGYDLAGKAMEVMTGKSIIRLFHDNLYRPMGIDNISMSDMAYSAMLTSYELGILGQWLANHGSYGDKQFISEETFQKLLPIQLSKYYPGVEVEWGIGLTPYRETRQGAPSNSKDPKDLILGEHVVGHGSATACILRVDLDNDLVIAQVRNTAGPKYGEYLPKFLQAIADSLAE